MVSGESLELDESLALSSPFTRSLAPVVDLEVNSVSGDGDGSVEPLAANSEVLVPVVDSLLVLETVGSFASLKRLAASR